MDDWRVLVVEDDRVVARLHCRFIAQVAGFSVAGVAATTSQAEQMVRALREKNRPVWYLLALDEGHGFKKKETVDYAWSAMLYFLREQLVGGGAGPSGAR